MSFGSKRIWFVSHPSGGTQHTPTFFSAINTFAVSHSDVIEIIFPHDTQEGVKLTREQIEGAELVLVEVSISSTGSGIEMGWANAAGKPIIAFHQGGSQPSPAMQFVAKAIQVYVTEEDILQVLNSL